jgi:hypothetical protein
MKRVAVSVLVCVLAVITAPTYASEGKTKDEIVAPAAGRTSQYQGTVRAFSQKSPARSFKSTAVSAKIPRGQVQQSTSFSDFYIYNATSTLRQDRDGDGYHSEFKIRFDADVTSGDASVYAKLYLRRLGEDEWFLYHETDDFWISGQSDSDDYYVITALDDGYPTAEYDVLIDLYESGVNGVVATLGPSDSGALSYLPLEEAGLDLPAAIDGYSIEQVTTELIADEDRDGYYSAFSIAFDPDAAFERRLAYAHIWVRARGGEWIDEFSSEDFWIETAGVDDGYQLDVQWQTGYPTSLYDVQIDLHDSATGVLLASAGSERAALSQIPFEDQSRDQRISSPTPGDGGQTSSREGGGGSFGTWSIAVLATLMLIRSKRRRSETH